MACDPDKTQMPNDLILLTAIAAVKEGKFNCIHVAHLVKGSEAYMQMKKEWFELHEKVKQWHKEMEEAI